MIPPAHRSEGAAPFHLSPEGPKFRVRVWIQLLASRQSAPIHPNSPLADSGIDWANIDRERVGVYIGVTEHGNVETENEIYEIKGYDYDT